MKKYLTVAAGSIAGAALMMAAAPAMAGVDVGINFGLPGFFPAPVYVQPPPVYMQPPPVYVQPEPAYVQPQPVYAEPPPYYVERGHDWQRRRWHEWHRWHERHEHGDDDD